MKEEKWENKRNLVLIQLFHFFVKLLDGSKKIYQFPNDLREAMLESYANNELRKMMKGALINVPTTPYKNGKAKLTLGMIKDVFADDKRRYWRTR